MKKLATITDRVLARLVPKQEAKAAGCYWEYNSPLCQGFDAYICGPKVYCTG
ncbi:hypothetical protein AB0I28_29115 [Phytomonospora sp. NPDC050363]|uniref:hypothetical protein n=1 Tax=Phytomonospora sp. NPDC050363 TaxID=3155642 RepID=UPI0033D82C0E